MRKAPGASRPGNLGRPVLGRLAALAWPWPLVALLGAACSDPIHPMDTWIGREARGLTDVWGQPSESRSTEAGTDLIYVSYWKDGFRVTHTCRRVFTTNPGGTITGHSATGC